MRTNFNMAFDNISLVKGDTLSFNVELDGVDTLDSAYFTCKKIPTSNTNIFKKSIGDGISKIEDGLYVVTVDPADTSGVDAGMYYYDFQIGVNGDVFTIFIGMLELIQDVTN